MYYMKSVSSSVRADALDMNDKSSSMSPGLEIDGVLASNGGVDAAGKEAGAGAGGRASG